MLVALASGKGGTGKTFVATNLFKLMESKGMDAALVDCDAEVPNDSIFFPSTDKAENPVKSFLPSIRKETCLYCGACADICRFHALTCVPRLRYIRLSDEICHGCRACQYVCKTGSIRTSWKETGKVSIYYKNREPFLFEGKTRMGQRSPVPVIQETLRTARNSRRKYLLLDAPPGSSCPFVNTVLFADYVLLIAEPTPFGQSDLEQTLRVLQSLKKPIGVIINRADIGGPELKTALAEQGISVVGEIPHCQDIAQRYASGQTVLETRKDLKSIFENILETILQHEDSIHQR